MKALDPESEKHSEWTEYGGRWERRKRERGREREREIEWHRWREREMKRCEVKRRLVFTVNQVTHRQCR